jgi:hypothetical protein
MKSYLVYETTGCRPDDHTVVPAATKRGLDGYITQAQTGRRYVLETPDGGIWIADLL